MGFYKIFMRLVFEITVWSITVKSTFIKLLRNSRFLYSTAYRLRSLKACQRLTNAFNWARIWYGYHRTTSRGFGECKYFQAVTNLKVKKSEVQHSYCFAFFFFFYSTFLQLSDINNLMSVRDIKTLKNFMIEPVQLFRWR